MKPFRADLHTHTCFSDGTATPTELIDLALSQNLAGLSITDHDTVGAYEEAIPYAEEKGLPLLPGIEFSATEGKEPVHILGYAFQLHHPGILAFCEEHRRRRLERNRKILDLLSTKGFPIKESDIPQWSNSSKQTLGRPHIALAMIEKGYVKTVKEAFQKYLGEGKLCFVPGYPFPVEETIDLIHQAKGFAILAHPHLISRPRIVNRLIELPFDGLEGYYARMSCDQERKWLDVAKKRDWIITGGSDFHGTVKPSNPLGASWVQEETFNLLYHRSLENS